MEEDPVRIMNNLRLIALLSPFDKLLTNNDRFDIHAPSRLRELYRTWQGESRSNNIIRVRQTVHSAFLHINKSVDAFRCSEGSPTAHHMHRTAMQHVRMCHSLSSACTGLKNLGKTYKEDATISSQIENCIVDVRDFLVLIHPETEKLKRMVSPEHPPLTSQITPASPPLYAPDPPDPPDPATRPLQSGESIF